MGLIDTGERLSSVEDERALTKDSEGNKVIVVSTSSAVEDYGWPKILSVASKKHANGDLVPNVPAGNPTQVRVTTTDIKEA